MLLRGVWIGVYASLSTRVLSLTPIFFMLASTTGTIPMRTAPSPCTVKTFLQALASQMPSLFVSYLDSFISALALLTSPLALPYGA